MLLGVSVLVVLLIYVSGWRIPGSVVRSFCSDGFTDLGFRLESVVRSSCSNGFTALCFRLEGS